MLFNSGDSVEVTDSKCGYKGPGVIVDAAYGNNWLVAIDDPKFPKVILVRLGGMRTSSVTSSKPKKSLR